MSQVEWTGEMGEKDLKGEDGRQKAKRQMRLPQ